ncbi:MAG: CBS domain-containing protein [Candidatus Binataceae bacterium]
MEVERIMNRNAKVCHPDETLNQAARIMWENRCGGVPVVDEQFRPVGFLTDRDVCMAAYTQGKSLDALRVEGAMARKLVCCKAQDDLVDAATLMRQTGVRRLPVTDREGKLVGILSLDDLAHEATRKLKGAVNEPLRNLVAEVCISINRGHVRVNPPV